MTNLNINMIRRSASTYLVEAEAPMVGKQLTHRSSSATSEIKCVVENVNLDAHTRKLHVDR